VSEGRLRGVFSFQFKFRVSEERFFVAVAEFVMLCSLARCEGLGQQM
jgi:hypothetical protein